MIRLSRIWCSFISTSYDIKGKGKLQRFNFFIIVLRPICYIFKSNPDKPELNIDD